MFTHARFGAKGNGARFALLLLAIMLVLSGCKSAEEKEAAEGGDEGGENAAETRDPLVANTSEAARFLDIERAGWSETSTPGNFARLTVVNDEGNPVDLSVESLDVKVTIEGRMARTEVTQVFKNHLPRQIEGTYEFQLPERAAISRLAMDVNGVMMEGELVERERAREIYEQIVRSMKDPALLEWQGGNRFKTQIFPIFANDVKTVVLAYEQLLPEDSNGLNYLYSLPRLAGDTANDQKIAAFDFELTVLDGQRKVDISGYPATVESVDGRSRIVLSQKNFLPAGPVEVSFEVTKNRDPVVRFAKRETDTKKESFYLLDIVPKFPEAKATEARNLVIAIDTSASLGDPVVNQSKVAALMLIDRLPAGTRFNVVHGDYKTQTCSDRPLTHEDFQTVVACLKGLDSGGASNLSGLVGEAVNVAKTFEGPASVVFFSDGGASLGELDGDVMRGQIQEAIGAADVSVHAVAVGHTPAEDGMRGIAGSGAGHFVRMTPSNDPAAVVAELETRVREPLMTDVVVDVLAGQVTGLSPGEPQTLARGEALAVLGRLDGDSAKIRIRGNYQGEAFEKVYSVSPQAPPKDATSLLANFWARSEIANMHREGTATDQVVAFSLEYGVMSPYTSFLVLENDQAYQRFNVERRKLAQQERERKAEDQLTQGQKNLEKSDKSLQEVMEAKDTPASPKKKVARDPAPAPEAAASPDMAGGFEGGESPGLAREQFGDMEEEPMEAWDGRDNDDMGLTGSGSGRADRSKSAKRGGGGKGWDGGGRSRRRPANQVVVGHVAVFGKLDRDQVAFGMATVASNARWCATQELTTAGHAVFEMEIDSAGKASNIKNVKSTAKGGKIASCFTDQLTAQVFSPSKVEGETVKVRVRFGLANSWEGIPALTNEERIAELELDIEGLTPAGFSELISLQIAAGNNERARENFDKAMNTFQQQTELAHQLFSHPSVRVQFEVEFLASIDAMIKIGNGDQVSHDLLDLASRTGKWNELTSRLGTTRLQAWSAQAVLRGMINHSKTEEAAGLLKQWETTFSARELLDIIHNESLQGSFTEPVFRLSGAAIRAGDADPVMVDRHIQAGKTLNKTDLVVENIKTACTTTTSTVLQCRGWVAEVAPDRIDAIMVDVTDKRLASMDQIRSRDVGNVELIKEFVAILRDRKRDADADRLLSEIVEFNAHDTGARQVWANELAMLERPLEACEAHGHTVQLDPRQRDLFRTMMGLRRQYENERENIRECVVRGVSNLPVNRAVSLILTWEDPEADVDLHIYEPTGDHVFFMARESSNGGLLYYDIRDGFGPEIYVLGAGPEGEYKLKLVYFRGDAVAVNGTLTVLRNAGSANETREDIPFTLKAADPDTEIDVGKFVLKK